MKKLILITLLFVCGAALAQKDVKFALEAANGNLTEVKLGELAMQNGYSDAVKQLGKMMKEEHSQGIIDLMEITTKKGIAVPTTLDEKSQRLYDKLSQKNAEDFDKAYTKAMVKDHKKDICKFKKEAKRGKDADFKEYAAKTVPVLQHHLEMSKSACDQVKKK